MGRHPFKEYADKYMESVRGVYAEETWKNRARRYNRMNNKLIELKEAGKISTTSPKTMTPEDVRVYILYCKERQSTADLVHEVNALRKILNFVDNHAVEICLNHNPGLKPSFKGSRRKNVMSDEVYEMILDKSKTIDPTDFNKVRAYTLVLMCINTGTRNKEIRFAEVRDLDTTSWLFDIIHVMALRHHPRQGRGDLRPAERGSDTSGNPPTHFDVPSGTSEVGGGQFREITSALPLEG